VLANCSDYEEIVDYGRDKGDFLWEKLRQELQQDISSEDTLWRVMRYLEPKELGKGMLSCWKAILSSVAGKHICLDDKQIKGYSTYWRQTRAGAAAQRIDSRRQTQL